ncbi:IS66 family insertion sequence element accessory protein TnpB [Agrobacterium tumefaciens]|nr:IS66 family insertion sequence element accessory protein TnpB [Agrobacterium tumefaciens]MCW8146044.1 IS66 family insertion sequence element accessory protein TnpB [Agrobacterium tumefaciens]
MRILIASKPVDFRKGINGLAALVSTTLGANPYSGDVYTYHRQRTTRARAAALAGDRCRDPRLDRG